jgi:hypothetical protein
MSTKRKWDQEAPPPPPSEDQPSKRVDEGKSASEAALAAAAIAAKIAAQFAAGGPAMFNGQGGSSDADFTHDIDINDVRNRYMLTKGSTQMEVGLSYFPTSSSRCDV